MKMQEKQVFPLGFGTGRIPEMEIRGKMYPQQDKIDEMIRYAYEHGINYYDSAPLYCSCHCEAAVGSAVKDFRKDIFLAGKLQGEETKAGNHRRALERTLGNLQTDYLDYYYFWGINRYFFDEYIVKKNTLGDMFRYREEGLIRNIAFSFHGQPEEVRYIIDRADALGMPFDACLVQYNMLDRKNEEMITYAHKKEIQTFAMGPGGGGRLAIPSALYQRLTGKKTIATYELALRFVMGNPDMDCTLSGMENLEMVKENIAVAEQIKKWKPSDWKILQAALSQLQKFGELYCTGCKYCQPCPQGIQIHDIFKCYTYHNVYGLSGYAKGAYLEYIRRGGKYYVDCLNCGKCEEKCPQKLDIRKELERIDGILRNIVQEEYRYKEHDHGEYL